MTSASLPTVRLLGDVALLQEGVRVPVRGQRQLRVLASLALNPGQIVAREAVIRDSWDGDPPRTVVGQLQTSAWMIRTALEQAGLPRDLLRSHRAGYRLRVPPERVDLFVFREEMRAVRVLYTRGEYEAACERLDRALPAWRGVALADVASGRLRLTAENLNRELAAARELRALIDIGRARFDEAIPRLAELLDQDPLREDLYVGLMKAYYGAGRQADAIHLFHRARRTLREQIGVSPGARLTATIQAVLAQDDGSLTVT